MAFVNVFGQGVKRLGESVEQALLPPVHLFKCAESFLHVLQDLVQRLGVALGFVLTGHCVNPRRY